MVSTPRRRSSLPASSLFLFCLACAAVGCDKLATTTGDAEITDQRVELPDRFNDEEEEQPAPPPQQPVPEPEPEPMVELPPIELPPALVGGVTECVVNGVIFRATECYRTARGFRLTVYCGSNERDSVIIFNRRNCGIVGEPSLTSSSAAVLPGPHVAERIELPRGKVIWFQLEPPRLPIEDTSFESVTIGFDSLSTIDSNVAFFGIPVTGDALPAIPPAETAMIPQRLERFLSLGPICQTVWRFNDFLGDTSMHIESFDPATRAITGFFQDVDNRELTKHFEGQLAADGMTFTIKTIRGSGIGIAGTAEISNINLYLKPQVTEATFHLVRTDLLGVSPDGVAFCARLPETVSYD